MTMYTVDPGTSDLPFASLADAELAEHIGELRRQRHLLGGDVRYHHAILTSVKGDPLAKGAASRALSSAMSACRMLDLALASAEYERAEREARARAERCGRVGDPKEKTVTATPWPSFDDEAIDASRCREAYEQER